MMLYLIQREKSESVVEISTDIIMPASQGNH